jgi:hypothetical protein
VLCRSEGTEVVFGDLRAKESEETDAFEVQEREWTRGREEGPLDRRLDDGTLAEGHNLDPNS